MTILNKISSMSLIVLAVFSGVCHVGAAEIEEVIVTAQKRSQNLNDVGISVSVLSGDDISRLGLGASIDIVNLVPNVENISILGPGTNTNFSIRGVTQNDFNDATEAPIATYIDGVYLVSTGAGSFPLYDMQRVEILRGPQGTLFGRNSTGGLIHFITANPEDVNSGSITTSYGSYDSSGAQGYVNLAMTDTLSFRLSGYYSSKGAWADHITGNQPDGGQFDTDGVRAALAFKPNDKISNILKVSYNKAKGVVSAWHDSIDINPDTGLIFSLPRGTPDFAGNAPLTSFKKDDNGSPNRVKASAFMAINELEWAVNDTLSLTSITGYNSYKKNVINDCDGIQAFECVSRYINPSHQFSQEVRAFIDLEDKRFTVGGYYLNQHQSINGAAPLVFDPPGGGIALIGDTSQVAEGYAIFANAEFDLNEEFTLITGLRVARDKKDIDQRLKLVLPLDPENAFFDVASSNVTYGAVLIDDVFNDETANGLSSFEEDSWNAKLELDYKPTDDTLIYASISRGTKAPGYNNGFTSLGLPFDQYQFDDEVIWAYELGAKTTFWDRKASLTASVFYYDYTDYQTLSFIDVGTVITNSDAKLYGAEFEFTAVPTDGLTVSLNAGLLKSELYDVTNAGGFVDDYEMPIAPSWTANASVRYETSINDDLIFGVGVDGRARDSFTNDPVDNPASIVPMYAIVNAGFDVASTDEKWKFSLSVKNLFDRKYIKSIFLALGVAGDRWGYYGDPRSITGEFTYNF